jgi:hypothetical protein
MKKVLLVVALLLLATPLFAADVTVTATKVGSPVGNLQRVDIGWSGAADACSIRAFALSLTTDTNAVISNIRGFKVGESNATSKGYGIFPARFRQYITPLNGTDVNSWSDANYNPLSVWGDPNCGWGINTAWIVTELGTLYTGDSNAPGTSGTLFTIDVNSTLTIPADCNLCIALDQIRGGVVKKDTTAATVTLPPGGSGAPAGCIRVTYAPPSCTEPNLVNKTMADANTALTTAGFTASPIITYEPNGLKTALTVDRQTPAFGAVVACNTATSYVVDTNCLYVGRVFSGTGITTLTVTQAMVDRWNALGRPNCWCCSTQKRGNVVYTPASTASKVDLTDLAKVKNAAQWNKVLGDAGYNANPCLDTNLSGKIDLTDLAKIKNAANWNVIVGPGPPCQ